MATYSITHRCGHETAYAMRGRVSDRERRASWISKGLCRECYAAHAKDRARTVGRAKGAQVRALLATYDIELPALEGTEKQVPWAEDIRAEIVLQAPVLAGFLHHEHFRKARTWIDMRHSPTPGTVCSIAGRYFPSGIVAATWSAATFTAQIAAANPQRIVEAIRKMTFEQLLDERIARSTSGLDKHGAEGRELLRAAIAASLTALMPTWPLYLVIMLDRWMAGDPVGEEEETDHPMEDAS